MAHRPYVVNVGTDRERTFASERTAQGYALHETAARGIGTHTIISYRNLDSSRVVLMSLARRGGLQVVCHLHGSNGELR